MTIMSSLNQSSNSWKDVKKKQAISSSDKYFLFSAIAGDPLITVQSDAFAYICSMSTVYINLLLMILAFVWDSQM